MQVNTKKVIDGFKLMLKDSLKTGIHPKEKAKLLLTLGGAAAMLLGAVPALLFARNSLNNFIARTFGSVRTFGGFLGDLSILLFSTKPTPEERKKERIVGSFFLIPTFMDFAQRWINQSSEANEIFNHAKTALNTVGELIWTHFSTERNDQQSKIKQVEQQTKLQRSLLQAA